jgi:hypothetical protein
MISTIPNISLDSPSIPTRDPYACRHFTTAWKGSLNDAKKGLAGENFLYEALQTVARIENEARPGSVILAQLGEPSQAEILGRTNDYPDCWLKIGDFESLWEARNTCYDRFANPKDPKQEFFRTPLSRIGRIAGVKDITKGKLWDADRYPVRGTQRQVWNPAIRKPVTDYERWVYPTIKQKVRRFYVSTIGGRICYHQDAIDELDRFFGGNQIYTNHPMLTDNLCRDAEDRACAKETFGHLVILINEKVRWVKP